MTGRIRDERASSLPPLGVRIPPVYFPSLVRFMLSFADRALRLDPLRPESLPPMHGREVCYMFSCSEWHGQAPWTKPL